MSKPVWHDLGQDLRFGLRGLRRSPGFAILVTLTLGLGIGANAAIFGVANAIFVRALPVRDPGALVALSQGTTSGVRGEPDSRVELYSYPVYRALAQEGSGGERPVFTGLAAQQSGHPRIVLRHGATSDADAIASARLVSGNYFEVLGLRAHRGRLLGPADDVPGAAAVAVLSHAYWQRRFGGDPAVVGARVSLNGVPATIVGIAPLGFAGANVGARSELFVPLAHQAGLSRSDSLLPKPTHWWLQLFGRLAPGVSRAEAEARANQILQGFLRADPALAKQVATDPGPVHITVAPGAGGLSDLRDRFGRPLATLMAGVGLLLLIVCLNLSHLLLARAVGRRREMSIRVALGASRWRLVRQLLTEGFLLAVLGALTGLLATRWFTDGLLALAFESPAVDVAIDSRVLGFTLLLALACATLLGLVPAWHGLRSDPQAVLRGTAPAVGGGRQRLGRVLLASQVAFSLVLLVGAGLLAGSLDRLRALDKGFADERLLFMTVFSRSIGIGDEEMRVFYRAVLPRLEAITGVRGASLSSGTGRLLAQGADFGGVRAPGRSGKGGKEAEIDGGVMMPVVTRSHLQTVGLRLVRGRWFLPGDSAGAPRVAVINETLAWQLFGGAEAALGGSIVASHAGPAPHQVVGVIKDARNFDLRAEVPPVIYRVVDQAFTHLHNLEIRSEGDPAWLAAEVRRIVHELNPRLVLAPARTVESRVAQALGSERLLATLSLAFGFAALFLVSVGLYGVISQWAAQRTQEIGVRVALGATAGGVRWLVLRQALGLVLAGVAVGLPAAVGAAHLLAALLYGTGPIDVGTLTGSATVMLAVAILAAYLPARRASRVQPMAALRCE